jgi:hypothetical protein
MVWQFTCADTLYVNKSIKGQHMLADTYSLNKQQRCMYSLIICWKYTQYHSNVIILDNNSILYQSTSNQI